ncbi:hypothetical protein PTSG_09949 [Salpingoeca rosetta]|uniref:Uncharacterized protein n=1 Tax=Salpingoeca rosetta (strain ATCC 50818 / BSB-021) TaxID=946362 RepID=F2UNM3_SALR5|nr:uncharacterized protein PTSG_09949 [Salpingoeca rosetta]EGD79228.1 hypothetical protein PTSG_09949 [Salpingoeca rosetta]|eukprot:XP_004989313.1 hypothetical protein PTSG_09949 [Salpingoeca rosetta]
MGSPGTPMGVLQADFQRLIDQALLSPVESTPGTDDAASSKASTPHQQRYEPQQHPQMHKRALQGSPGLSPVRWSQASMQVYELDTPAVMRTATKQSTSSSVASAVSYELDADASTSQIFNSSTHSENAAKSNSSTNDSSDTSSDESVARVWLTGDKENSQANASTNNDAENNSAVSRRFITPIITPSPNSTPPASVKLWRHPFTPSTAATHRQQHNKENGNNSFECYSENHTPSSTNQASDMPQTTQRNARGQKPSSKSPYTKVLQQNNGRHAHRSPLSNCTTAHKTRFGDDEEYTSTRPKGNAAIATTRSSNNSDDKKKEMPVGDSLRDENAAAAGVPPVPCRSKKPAPKPLPKTPKVYEKARQYKREREQKQRVAEVKVDDKSSQQQQKEVDQQEQHNEEQQQQQQQQQQQEQQEECGPEHGGEQMRPRQSKRLVKQGARVRLSLPNAKQKLRAPPQSARGMHPNARVTYLGEPFGTASRILQSASKNCAGRNSPRTRKEEEQRMLRQHLRSMRHCTFAEKLRIFRQAELMYGGMASQMSMRNDGSMGDDEDEVDATEQPQPVSAALGGLRGSVASRGAHKAARTPAHWAEEHDLHSTINDLSELLDVDELIARHSADGSYVSSASSQTSSNQSGVSEGREVFDDIERHFNSANTLATTLIERLRMRASNNSSTLLSGLRQRLGDAEQQIDALKKDKVRLQRQVDDASNENRRVREDLDCLQAQLVKAREAAEACRDKHAEHVHEMKQEWEAERRQLEKQIKLAKRVSGIMLPDPQTMSSTTTTTNTTAATTTAATTAGVELADAATQSNTSTASTGGRVAASTNDSVSSTRSNTECSQQVISEQMEEIENLTRDMRALREKTEAELGALRQELDAKSTLVAELQGQVDETTRERTRAEEDLAQLKKHMATRDEEHQQEIERTRQEHNARETELASLVTALEEELMATTEQVRKEKATLIQALRDKDGERREAVQQVSSLKKQVQLLMEEQEAREREYAERATAAAAAVSVDDSDTGSSGPPHSSSSSSLPSPPPASKATRARGQPDAGSGEEQDAVVKQTPAWRKQDAMLALNSTAAVASTPAPHTAGVAGKKGKKGKCRGKGKKARSDQHSVSAIVGDGGGVVPMTDLAEYRNHLMDMTQRNASTVSAPCFYTNDSIADDTRLGGDNDDDDDVGDDMNESAHHPKVYINPRMREGFFKRMGRRLRRRKDGRGYHHM